MSSRSKVRGIHRRVVKGVSGVTHTLNVVTIDDAEYIFTYYSGSEDGELELIRNVVIALDTKLGLYVKSEEPLPAHLFRLLSKLPRYVIDYTED